MTREEVTKHLNILLANRCWDCREIAGNKVCDEECMFKQAFNEAIEALKADDEDEPQFYTEDDYWNGMFAESAEAYKAWTGEEMGKTNLIRQKDAISVAVETCWNCSNYRCNEIKTALYALPTVKGW